MTTFDESLKRRGIDTNSESGPVKTDRAASIGDQTGGNKSTFEDNGTLKFEGDAVVWDDLVIPLSSAKVPAVNAPTWASLIGNLNAYTYAVDDYQEFAVEMLHSYKEGTNFEFHIHGAINGLVSGVKGIKFEIEYTIANMEGVSNFNVVFPATTTVEAELTIPDATADLTSFYFDIADITGTTYNIGATIVGRLRRIIAVGAAPAADPFITQVGVHYVKDTVGSREEYTK